MVKKSFIVFLFILLTGSIAFAQTQQGYVKTRGRLAANGKSVVEGKRLSNAIVTIEKRSSVKSGKDGTFSFVLPYGTKHYRVQNVQLKGYVLSDPDVLQRTFTYSKDMPLVVVLEDSKQREADLEAARKSVRITMNREIRKKQTKIDSLLEVNAITQTKYDSLIQDFQKYRQSSEDLVKEMAEKYVSIDYDQLDDFNRKVQSYIEQGELLKADSLIRSKGSREERFNRIMQDKSTNAQRESEIQQEQEELSKSQKYTQKEIDDFSKDLYSQHLIFLQQPLMQDSALACLKMRADLDTTNLNAVKDYALLAHIQYKLSEAEKYYLICFRAYIKQNYRLGIMLMDNNLLTLYRDLGDYESYTIICMQTLNMSEKTYENDPLNNTNRAHLAHAQLNMGILYRDIYAYSHYSNLADSSELYFKKALKHFEKLSAKEPEDRLYLALVRNNLGNIYMLKGDYDNCEKYYKLALKTYEKLDTTFEVHRDGIAQTQHNLGDLNYNRQDFITSEFYYKLAYENYGKLYVKNHDAYREKLILTYSNLLLMYAENGQLSNKADVLKKYRSLFMHDSVTVRIIQQNVITSLYNIASHHVTYQDYTNAINTLDEALVLMPDNPNLFYAKGEIFLMQGEDQEALQMWQKVLELNPKFLDDYLNGTELSNGLKAKGLIK